MNTTYVFCFGAAFFAASSFAMNSSEMVEDSEIKHFLQMESLLNRLDLKLDSKKIANKVKLIMLSIEKLVEIWGEADEELKEVYQSQINEQLKKLHALQILKDVKKGDAEALLNAWDETKKDSNKSYFERVDHQGKVFYVLDKCLQAVEKEPM